MARQRQKDKQDLGAVRAVKDEAGKVLTDEEEIKRRWKEYFEQLMNTENPREALTEAAPVEGPIQEVQWKDVKVVLSKMKRGTASGPSEVTAELIKVLGIEGEEWMWELLNSVWENGKIPEEWRKSILIPIYKQKGDILQCGNSRGIKLTEHAMKVLDRVIDDRLRRMIDIDDMQCGFMKGKGTVDAIFTMRQLQEKTIEGNEKLYCAFVDLEKAYDRVP